ncbi:S-adenosyl-L-methionine-dependent methyltransferase [Trametes meyenii]|nr:S-adenosyl-L-methionine-dependent methyltransferase [Trametes meyenii]
MTETNGESKYIFRAATAIPEEVQRLDDMHNGITDFLGGLSFVKLDDPTAPSAILEMGSGSGAWAIQAAEIFPHSHVVAADLNPIPPRPLPDNLEYQCVDITKPFPFEKESFDIVHARLVLIHVPGAEDVLRRAVDLIKPGGWLLVDEPDDYAQADGSPGGLGPGTSAVLKGWKKVLESSGADPQFGSKLKGIVESTGAFDKVHVNKVVVPISGKSEDPKLRKLGLTWKQNLTRVGQDLPSRWAEYGITPEMASQWIEEMHDPLRSMTTEMYFLAARKGTQ